MNTPNVVIILALAVLFGAVLAVAAMALGLWFAGRLTGVMGRPMMVVDPDGRPVMPGVHDQSVEEPGPELAPWEGDEPPQEGVDLGADPDNWKEAE